MIFFITKYENRYDNICNICVLLFGIWMDAFGSTRFRTLMYIILNTNVFLTLLPCGIVCTTSKDN